MLEVQRELRGGKTLEDLKTELGIKHNFSDDRRLVSLNYSMVGSPKTHPVVKECRGIILENNTWVLVSMAFYRFFNHGEAPEEVEGFNFERAYAVEKIDGSIIQLFHYAGKWRMATRGVIDGDNIVNFSGKTFGSLFWATLDRDEMGILRKDTDIIYTFELVSSYNRIVTPYAETKLYLIGARNRKFENQEIPIDYIHSMIRQTCLGAPKYYPIPNVDYVFGLLDKLQALEEGFVVVDEALFNKSGSFARIKFKSATYLQASKMKDNASTLSGMVGVVMSGNVEALIETFPELASSLYQVRDKWKEYQKAVEVDISQVQHLLGREMTPENRKEYALFVKGMTNSSFMFSLLQGQCVDLNGFIDNMRKKKQFKTVCKAVLKWLGLDERIFVEEE